MSIDLTGSKVDDQVLAVRRLSKTYRHEHGVSLWKKSVIVPALQDIEFTLGRRKILGVWGPSGAGKSTLARCIACLEPWDSGELNLAGQCIDAHDSRRQQTHTYVQLVLQDSGSSLNPNFSALQTVREPLDILRKGSRFERDDVAKSMMKRVGLQGIPTNRAVTHLSGGERQRLALARALIVRPVVLVLDETLSGLDLAVQAGIVNLMLDLQEEFAMSCVFISHNLRLTRHVADEVLVLNEGRIVRNGRLADCVGGQLPWN
jgi:ABC-type glutathione transport system ATPase component